MEEVQCDSESSDTEDWKTSIFEERIEFLSVYLAFFLDKIQTK